MSLLKPVFFSVFGSILILVGILFFRSEVYYSRSKIPAQCNQTHEPIQGEDLINRFSQAIQIKTITQESKVYDTAELIRFAQFLKTSFPVIYSSPLVTVETVSNYSLLYHVKGSDPKLTPYLLCSHMDVVPVERKYWDMDPFGGIVKDGYIYGRGTIDVKDTLMAIMESLEYLLKDGFKPRRSFYIAFGHDEEGLGSDGASQIAETFRRKGVKKFEFLLDEGMPIFKEGGFPGITSNVALIGVSEKGFLSVKLKSAGEVGHSSMAPYETSITILAKAVSKFNSHVHPSFFGMGPERRMFEEFAMYAQYPFKLVYSNLWLFGPILSRIISAKPSGNAVVRTSTAPTIINGGFKQNVLPSEAEAVINHRIHPMQTINDVIEFDRRLINDDRVTVEIFSDHIEPHPISPYERDSFGYQTIGLSIQQVFDNTIVIPGIMVASTDTRWYLSFTKAVYRFSPILLTQEETKRFHGHNECIGVDNYIKVVNFYHHLMINADQDRLPVKTVRDEL